MNLAKYFVSLWVVFVWNSRVKFVVLHHEKILVTVVFC